MTIILLFLLVILLIGIFTQSGPGYSVAIGFDAMVQDLIWSDTNGITISSRCGLAQRRGVLWPAQIVNFVMRSPTHCQDAIAYDIARAKQAIAILEQPIT